MSDFPAKGSIVTEAVEESSSKVTRSGGSSIMVTRPDESSSKVTRSDESDIRVTRPDSKVARLDESSSKATRKGEPSIRVTMPEEASSNVTRAGGSSIMAARPGESSSKVARLDEPSINVTRPEESSITVTREGRHKGVPPQVVKGPSVAAKKAEGYNTGPSGLARGGREGRAQLSAVAQVVAQQADRAGLDALCAGPSNPQSRGRQPRVPTRDGTHLAKAPVQQHEEWVSQSARILSVVVRQTSPEPRVLYVKRPCQPRPRAQRCDELPARWKTQELKDKAKAVLREVRDA